MIKKIISGGQTGADMGGLLAADFLGIPTGGYCPDKYVDENGFNSEFIPRFNLKSNGNLTDRTLKNIEESDATLIFAKKQDSPGTKTTIKLCEQSKKPYYIVKSLDGIKKFLSSFNGILNIAGNRESVSPGIQDRTRDFLIRALMPENGVFVFGSNSSGVHGKGAALFAKSYMGAIEGNSSGLQGKSYAIVTKKDFTRQRSSSLEEIGLEIKIFLDFAESNQDKLFFVTQIGCGLAGYHYTEIASLFNKYSIPKNIILPPVFNPKYPMRKMMRNSSFAHNYNTLDKSESEYVKKYWRDSFVTQTGIINPDAIVNYDLYVDSEFKYLLSDKIDRLVIGDHGAYVEFDMKNIKADLKVKKGREYKLDSKYASTVKYIDLFPEIKLEDGKTIPLDKILIYHQKRTVDYADYLVDKLYVSFSEVFFKEKQEGKKTYLDKMEMKLIEEKKVEVKETETVEEKDENFVHLHVHGVGSLLDGLCEVNDLCKIASERKQVAVAMTDHGYMYNAYKFQKAANKFGIKPIHGVEAYFANDAFDKNQRNNYHIILLVMNEIGWKNLSHMMTMANRERFYYKPRVDEELLRTHNEGLICLSGCYKSPITYHMLEEGKDPDRAIANMKFFIEVFGDRFYNEAMHIGWEPYDKYYTRVLELADSLKVKTVCTGDVHYLKKEEAELQKILMNIQTDGTLESSTSELWFKTRNEMIIDYITPQMADTTLEIADRCNFELKFEGFKFPVFDIKRQSDYKQFYKENNK